MDFNSAIACAKILYKNNYKLKKNDFILFGHLSFNGLHEYIGSRKSFVSLVAPQAHIISTVLDILMLEGRIIMSEI